MGVCGDLRKRAMSVLAAVCAAVSMGSGRVARQVSREVHQTGRGERNIAVISDTRAMPVRGQPDGLDRGAERMIATVGEATT
jgi:hypothetical protein